MGLAFLIQYSYALYGFFNNYDHYINSYITEFISMNGLIQAVSAYFSFKVLPELADAGYYSDRAVLSRKFVFENCYFQCLSFFGSVWYNDTLRANLQSNELGKVLCHLFVFFPYVLIRPWFPTTHFKDAGSSMSGRSAANERFYNIGTQMIKFFYLWAKYFLGFYINFFTLVCEPTEHEWKGIRGVYLMNLGTVSTAVFLHTLRFKKILPPRLTFGIYLVQIYSTFVAIPILIPVFRDHVKLLGLTFLGLLANLTRSKKIQAVWSILSYYCLTKLDIAW